jgi:hypothetical protein
MEYVSCSRFEIIDSIVSALLSEGEKAATLRAKQDVVRDALESTAKIVKLSGKTPSSEPALHAIVHEHMEATFPGYLRKVPVATSPKYYIPDGALPQIELAIEWKYVKDTPGLKIAVDDIKTDILSYGRSTQFSRFFGIIYQTSSSICSPAQLAQSFSNSDSRWEIFLVTQP